MFALTERLPNFICAVLTVLTIFCSHVTDVAAQLQQRSAKSGSGKNYAIIIPVATFSHLDAKDQLAFTLNDAEHLSRTLKERGNFTIHTLSDNSRIAGQAPTKKNIEEKLPDWLAKFCEEDTVIVYVSTHGFADEVNRQITYIMPSDFDLTKKSESAIPSSWLRKELGKCKAGTKLLLIDACHAGGESDASDKSFFNGRASELAQYGDEDDEDLRNVIVFASSTKDEQSFLFPKTNLSLFSYWLNEGLKGHADKDCNGAISIDELYEYVYSNVTQTAEKIGVKQTPVRIVRTGTPGVPDLMKSLPITLDSLLEQIADQMVMAMDIHNQKQTAVPEFTVNSGIVSLLGREKYGLLSTYCANEVEKRLKIKLSQMGYGDYEVVQREKLQATLNERNIDTTMLEGIVKGVNPIPPAKNTSAGNEMGVSSIILGTLRDRYRTTDVHIQCELIDVGSRETINIAGGLATITENEWAMLGRSMVVNPNERTIQRGNNAGVLDTTRTTAATYAPSSVQGEPVAIPMMTNAGLYGDWDERSAGEHPLFQRNSVFDIQIAVKRPGTNQYRERLIQKNGGQAVVTLRKGEVFQIRLKNRLLDNDGARVAVAARVLVDGLNTLPEKRSDAMAKFAVLGDDQTDLEIGPRVNLANARFWIIPPTPSNWAEINGFFRNTGNQGAYNEFRVTDASNSLAAQKEFTEQIGIITVAFYELREKPGVVRSIDDDPRGGTELGDLKPQPVQEIADVDAGNLLAVYHIHYTAQ